MARSEINRGRDVTSWLLMVFPILLIALLLLKIWQVFCETKPWITLAASGDEWSFVDTLGYAVFRRLDDIDFWGFVALWLATRRLIQAAVRLSPKPLRFRSRKQLVKWIGRDIILVVSAIAACYLYSQAALAGRFTFGWSDTTFMGDKATVVHLQQIEGIVTWIGFWTALIALILGCEAGFRAGSKLCRRNHDLRSQKIASEVLRGCLTPFLGASLFSIAAAFIVDQLHVTKIGPTESATTYTTALGWMIIYASPYLSVAMILYLTFKHWGLSVRLPFIDKQVDWLDIEVRG